jgi:hypothetical protein
MRTYETGITESSELIVSRCLALHTAEIAAPLEGRDLRACSSCRIVYRQTLCFFVCCFEVSVEGYQVQVMGIRDRDASWEAVI